MSSKSQAELEQPAKVYQLMATDAKVDQALAMLKTISESVSGVVSEVQLEKRLKELSINLTEDIIKDIDIKYGSTKKTVDTWSKRLWGVTMVAISALIGNIISLINTFRG